MHDQREEEIIHLKVKAQDQEEIHFKIKTGTPLKKLMEKYVERIGLNDLSAVNFVYDGERIYTHSTPQRLRMRDGDEIMVTITQTGGRGLI